jgi:hypothetical protein
MDSVADVNRDSFHRARHVSERVEALVEAEDAARQWLRSAIACLVPTAVNH